MGRGGGLQPFQHRLDIRQIVDEVRENDVIEFFFREKFGGVGSVKFQAGMPRARQLNHRGTEINSHAMRGFDGGQQIADAAADFQHAQARRNEKGEIIPQELLIIAVSFPDSGGGALFIKRSAVNHSTKLVTEKTAAGERHFFLGFSGFRYDRPIERTMIFRSTRKCPPAPGKAADGWFTPGRFATLLAVFIALAFPGIILGQETFFIATSACLVIPSRIIRGNVFGAVNCRCGTRSTIAACPSSRSGTPSRCIRRHCFI